jgi:hypothetical protein
MKNRLEMKAFQLQNADFDLGSAQLEMPILNYSDDEEIMDRKNISSPGKTNMNLIASFV